MAWHIIIAYLYDAGGTCCTCPAVRISRDSSRLELELRLLGSARRYHIHSEPSIPPRRAPPG